MTREVRQGFFLVAECIHFTLFGIILPTIKRKLYTFELSNQVFVGARMGNEKVLGLELWLRA